jgi:hypothetical protein
MQCHGCLLHLELVPLLSPHSEIDKKGQRVELGLQRQQYVRLTLISRVKILQSRCHQSLKRRFSQMLQVHQQIGCIAFKRIWKKVDCDIQVA